MILERIRKLIKPEPEQKRTLERTTLPITSMYHEKRIFTVTVSFDDGATLILPVQAHPYELFKVGHRIEVAYYTTHDGKHHAVRWTGK
ncbi:MAG: hypothetical protein AAB420_00755 [Patescibacteria group bacterium]